MAGRSIKDRAFGQAPVQNRHEVIEIQPGQMAPQVRLRVRGSVRILDGQWAEVQLQVKRTGDTPWLHLTHPDRPILVARRYSGRQGEREVQELYVTACLRQALTANGATLWSLEGHEERVGQGVTEHRYWAPVGARLTVVLQSHEDGTVSLQGLA